MIESLISIRIKQIYRAGVELGLLRSLALLIFLGSTAFILLMQTATTVTISFVVGIYLFVLTLLHLRRQDRMFLKSHFNFHKWICLIEYLLLSLPLIAFMAYHFQWVPALLLLTGLAVIVNLDFKPNTLSLNTKVQDLIPEECFEWKAGVRKSFFTIIILLMVGLGTSFFIGSVPIVIFILGLLPMGFYKRSEPYQMITSFEIGSNKFLVNKVKWQVLIFTILCVPLIAVFIVFHQDRWYIPLVEYLIFVSVHVYMILTKYAFYEPNSRSSSVQTFGAVGAMGVIFPVFIPLVWLLSIRFYFKARRNLNFYLDDFN
jgi:hypothetical protein